MTPPCKICGQLVMIGQGNHHLSCLSRTYELSRKSAGTPATNCIDCPSLRVCATGCKWIRKKARISPEPQQGEFVLDRTDDQEQP